ncbi:hypothetical protein [Desulfomicrobium norvegicum]|nr:hypothetical protein [Desulfomicrobium norvegicum]
MSQQKELRLLAGAWCELNDQVRENGPANNVSGIVFSMDRPLQLHALLGSYRDLVKGRSKLTVIYRTTSSDYDTGYNVVFQEYEGMIEVRRQENRHDFRPLLLEVLSESPADNIFFLVDDNMFVESVDLTFFAGMASMYCVPSLRMGKNLARSYTLNRSQSVPSLFSLELQHDKKLQAWIWKYGELDWNYPLSVDGHFFQRNEILALAKSIDFDSPNHFEEKLQKFHGLFSWRLGVCYSKSRLINIPYNRVQTDIENLHGSVHQEDMLRMCQEGFRIDRKSYYGIVNESAHQEFPLRLKRQAVAG